MSSPAILRMAVAVSSALAVGVGIAFGSWHLRERGLLRYVQRGNASVQVASTGEEGRYSTGVNRMADELSSSTSSFPSLTQGAFVDQERQPTREEFATILEHEKQKAANEALTSYILTQEELPKLSQNTTSSQKPPAHPLVEELINKPNAMRGSILENGFFPGVLGRNDASSLGGYSQDVLREAFQAFNSPGNAALRADAKAVADMTLNHVSALKNLQQEVQSRLEQGRGGSLSNILSFGNQSGLDLSGDTRRAVGNMVANALSGAGSASGYGLGGGFPFMGDGNAMTPPVGSPTVPVVELDSSQLAAAAALVTEYRRLLPELSEAEMKEYLRRVEVDGKIAAMQWVVRTKVAK